MPKIESTPLTPEAEALVGRARDLLKGAKPGVPVTIPADLMHAINDEVLKASMPALLARRRLEWLHSRDSHNVDGYEWGVFRVKWGADGRAEEVWQTNGDFSDLDAAMGASPQAKSAPTASGEGQKSALRQQILNQLDRCHAISYGAGHHFAEHGKHAPSSTMAQADADAMLVRLIEEYAAAAPPPASGEGEVQPVPQVQALEDAMVDRAWAALRKACPMLVGSSREGIRAAIDAALRTLKE